METGKGLHKPPNTWMGFLLGHLVSHMAAETGPLPDPKATPFHRHLPHAPSQWPRPPALSLALEHSALLPRCALPQLGTLPPPWQSRCSPRGAEGSAEVREAPEASHTLTTLDLCYRSMNEHTRTHTLPHPAALPRPSAIFSASSPPHLRASSSKSSLRAFSASDWSRSSVSLSRRRASCSSL